MKKILKYTFASLMGCSVLTSCLDSALKLLRQIQWQVLPCWLMPIQH